MIKGTQKKIIHIKDTHSRIFGEAYFILKADLKADISENEMVREAARIVDENLLSIYCSEQLSPVKSEDKVKNTGLKSGAFAGFIAGASICSAVIGLIALITQII